MRDVKVLPASRRGMQFIAPEYLPQGQDEHYLRNIQVGRPPDSWRGLKSDEIETLVKNGNTCDDWDNLLVTDPFDPSLIKNCEFSGLVRIGRLEEVILEHHDLQMPAGMTNSHIIACDIGENCVIHNVSYLAHYIVGDNVMLLNIDEMHTTDHAKFGNGIIKDGEREDVRVWMDVMNETGGRSVLPFDGMIPADAYIWARFREDARLQARLKEITQKQFDSRRGYYGVVGSWSVIKNSRIIKDVCFGECCYVKGANKLKNLTIHSTEDEPTQVGEGVEMVNGIVGLGCRIFYGCKAVRFVMGDNSALKYGARLIHSLLGDNSTVSCCEMLNNLIFPAHEQHHNNSFLVASLVKGQSNLAAGATIGSNHNSRANDGEIVAGRGFWPGLCTTLKHCCKFASFVLLVKGDYPAELDIALPFSLISDDRANDRLLVMPAYWWLHNMYALARNTQKFLTRDRRCAKTQKVEFDSLAPDTAEEMFHAMTLLERWTAVAELRRRGERAEDFSDVELGELGRRLFQEPGATDGLVVQGEGMENSRRDVLVLRPANAWRAYREMLHYYAMKDLLTYMHDHPGATIAEMADDLAGPRQREWENLGGQLVPADDLRRILERIKDVGLDDWHSIHDAYDALWAQYPLARQRHAFATLLELYGASELTETLWQEALDQAMALQEQVAAEVRRTRAKDYDNPFRRMTYAGPEEMQAVVGTVEDNAFVRQVREQTEAFRLAVDEARSRSGARSSAKLV